MPQLNGTGPNGFGEMTGRRLGRCANQEVGQRSVGFGQGRNCRQISSCGFGPRGFRNQKRTPNNV